MLDCTVLFDRGLGFPVTQYALFQAEKYALYLVQYLSRALNALLQDDGNSVFATAGRCCCLAAIFEDVLHAGVVILKPWDSNKRWKILDGGAKHMLESLLHESPARRLDATTLLHHPWLYKAQGKPYPSERILGPHVSGVPPLISFQIQQRERHPQRLPVPLEPCGAHMDVQALWHEYHMAAQLGQPQSVGQAEAIEVGLTPYAAVHETSIAGTSAKGPRSLAAAAPYDPTTVGARAAPGSLPTWSPFAAPAVAPQSLGTALPKPGFNQSLDSSQYPYSVIPRRPDAIGARQHEAAAHLQSGAPPHGQYGSDGSMSLSDSRSMSVSPMGSEVRAGTCFRLHLLLWLLLFVQCTGCRECV